MVLIRVPHRLCTFTRKSMIVCSSIWSQLNRSPRANVFQLSADRIKHSRSILGCASEKFHLFPWSKKVNNTPTQSSHFIAIANDIVTAVVECRLCVQNFVCDYISLNANSYDARLHISFKIKFNSNQFTFSNFGATSSKNPNTIDHHLRIHIWYGKY